MKGSQETIRSANNLLNYFRQELQTAFDDLGMASSENTEAYLVQLLDGFVRLDPLSQLQVGFQKPAAFLLGEAMNSPGDQRIAAYRRLGDVTLFNCGFFDAHLTRRNTVDSQYYRDVGRIAYGQLSDLMMSKDQGGIFGQIYQELAGKFDAFVAAFKCLGSDQQTRFEHDAGVILDKLKNGETIGLDDLQQAGFAPPDARETDDET